MTSTNYTESELQALFVFYGNKCLACGSFDITRDHVVSVRNGGEDTLDNIQPLCKSCNSQKGTLATDYRPQSYPHVSIAKGLGVRIALRQVAESRNLNMYQVQKHTGIGMGLIRRYWNNNSQEVSRDAIDKLCALLDCEPGDLIKRTVTPAAS